MSDLPPEAADQPSPAPLSPGGSRRAIAIVVGSLLVAIIGGLFVWQALSDSDDGGGDDVTVLSPREDFLFQPADAPGPDPFTRSVANVLVDVEDEGLRSGVVVAGPGLYGGTNENVCDVDQLIEFLRENPDMARAWAEVQGLTVAELEDYLRSLEPAILLENTLVTNHGYRNGRATPFQAVLEAGTAVLVDEDGIPRARCACGNPLIPPDTPGEEPPTTSIPDVPTTTVTECPPTPPYGFQESDGGWILETEEGVYRWYEESRTWVATDGSEATYEDETLVPGYREECYPCPEDSSGSSSYEYRDGTYRTPEDVAEAEGEPRGAEARVECEQSGGHVRLLVI